MEAANLCYSLWDKKTLRIWATGIYWAIFSSIRKIQFHLRMSVSPITVPNMMHLFSRIFTLFFHYAFFGVQKEKKIRKCCFLKKYVHLVKVHKRGDTTILKINEACFILCINDRERAWHIINCLVQHDHHRKSKKISVLPTLAFSNTDFT